MSFRIQMKANFRGSQRQSASVDAILFENFGEFKEIPQTFRQRVRILTIDPHLSLGVSHSSFGQDDRLGKASVDNLKIDGAKHRGETHPVIKLKKDPQIINVLIRETYTSTILDIGTGLCDHHVESFWLCKLSFFSIANKPRHRESPPR